MYIVIQYTNHSNTSKNFNEIRVRGASESYGTAVALARESAEQCNGLSSADDHEDIFSCRCIAVRTIDDNIDEEEIKWHVKATNCDSIEKRKNGWEDGTRSIVEDQFISVVVTLCKNDLAIHNLWYNAHRLYSGYHQSVRAIEHPDARGISLAYMLREVMMPDVHTYTKELYDERKDAYDSMLGDLEDHDFDMSLLYMKQDDMNECVQKGTLPEKDTLADIGTVRRMLAYVWKHGGDSVQTYMEDNNLAEICYVSGTIFAVVSAPLID